MPKVTTTVSQGLFINVKKYGFKFSELIVEGFHEKMRRASLHKQTDLLIPEVISDGKMVKQTAWRERFQR